MEFSKKTRELSIKKMQERTLDLLIIGGGITGAGVALQAAASGLETGLIEMQDFAEGTSSRSTKLVHGGLRYLKQFDVEVVSDTVSERAVVQQIAPHIPKPDPMLLPVYDEDGATFSLFRLKVAMDLYDLLAGVSNTPTANKVLSKKEVLERQPNLKKEGLVGGGVYLDFRNNDARLVIENIKRANQDGALIANHVKAEGFLFDESGKITGVVARDLLTDQVFEIKARLVINTTGPWSDKVRNLSNKGTQFSQMRPTKGVHLVVDSSKIKVSQPVYFDTGLGDGRMVFVLPRENKIYFGTTDTDYTGDLEHPKVTQEDVDYLLGIVNNRFPESNITIDDIESSWAGLRPLIAGNSASDYNGGNNGTISDESFDNLIATVESYLSKEKTREDVESAVSKLESSTSEKHLDPSAVSRGLDSKEAHYLANLYGSNAPKVFALAHSLEQAPGLSLADTLSLHYAMRNELTLSPVDFLLRRTNHMLFMRDSLDSIVEPILDEMGRFYDWTEEEKATYRADVEAALANNDLAELKN
ncbi:glycerol-3-phosphate dehydrogenase%2C truncation [Streptococcus pneumoniae]|uniref:FAD-dependent oxidoreductase n=1 Tax=Streptococcus pneumoniae TaxID=1313 RepID=UPI0005DDF76B|nr:FAD-dependent oxidoreductase [Streptococcus pneumoniae]CIS85289.1 glycerol-3-phosphate dehydrogenase%2C truncation [Streptococcus pneumoniae]